MTIPTDQIDAVRRFNRFYTSFVGALTDHFLGSDYGLTPMRVLYQVGAAGAAPPVAAEVARAMGLDRAQISRAVAELEAGGLLERTTDPDHARRQLLRLTEAGRALYLRNIDLQRAEIGRHLDGMSGMGRDRLVRAMAEVESWVGGGMERDVRIRPLETGDMGWVIMAQTRLYGREYGWNGEYEALVLKILGEFAARLPSQREAGRIAEVDGVAMGAVFCMEKSARVAQLRLLHVEAEARGLGLGGKLVDECLSFARAAGYGRIELWTNDVLSDARKLYQSRGFTLVDQAAHHSFGVDLTGQTWGRDV
jgi:DNA-binding MarR family transcriptional regulator/GNAT superfamily N-acetyltransferase